MKKYNFQNVDNLKTYVGNSNMLGGLENLLALLVGQNSDPVIIPANTVNYAYIVDLNGCANYSIRIDGATATTQVSYYGGNQDTYATNGLVDFTPIRTLSETSLGGDTAKSTRTGNTLTGNNGIFYPINQQIKHRYVLFFINNAGTAPLTITHTATFS